MLIPIDKLRSQRYLSKPSLLRFNETRETCALSIAWTWMPESEHSNVASVKRSFTASNTFFRSALCTSRASNIVLPLCLAFVLINSVSFANQSQQQAYNLQSILAAARAINPRFCYRCSEVDGPSSNWPLRYSELPSRDKYCRVHVQTLLRLRRQKM